MKIVILDGYTLNPGDLSWEGFHEQGEVIVHDFTSADDTIGRIGTAEIVLTNKVPLTREILGACPSIRYIGVLATGYNVVDTAAAAEKGITVTNIPTYGTTAVSQFVFALLLEICHHVQDHSDAVKHGEWAQSGSFSFWKHPLLELSGKTMGIIGFGRIGQGVANIAVAFGMRVLAYDEVRHAELENENTRYVELDELYAASDVISLHCPLFDSNKGMINHDSIGKMKDRCILINTSRGGLVVEHDLADALFSGKIAAAGLDVVSTEPIQSDNPLLNAPNCFLTPHIAWAPRESRARLMDIAVENLRSFLEGKTVNKVN